MTNIMNDTQQITMKWTIGPDGYFRLSRETEEALLEADRERRRSQKVVDSLWSPKKKEES